MTTSEMVEISAEADVVKQQVSKNWWILLVQGILTVILGIMLLMNPPATLIAIAWVLGLFWLVGGIIDIVGAFTGRTPRAWYWDILAGAFSAIAGLILITQPLVGAVALPMAIALLLGVGAVIGGAFKVIGAIMMRKEIEGEFWMGLWGVILILLGGWIIFNLGASAIAYVFVMGILMIVVGVISVIGSFRLRSLGK